MNFSLSRSRESCFVWMFWFLGAWLVLETGAFLLCSWVFQISVHRLVGPYIALAVAPAVVGPFFYRINRRHAEPPKRRARNMGIASTAFIEIALTALSYSVVTLGAVSANFAITVTIVVWLLSGPIVYFGAYRTALAKIGLTGSA